MNRPFSESAILSYNEMKWQSNGWLYAIKIWGHTAMEFVSFKKKLIQSFDFWYLVLNVMNTVRSVDRTYKATMGNKHDYIHTWARVGVKKHRQQTLATQNSGRAQM